MRGKESFRGCGGFMGICKYPCSSKYVDLSKWDLCHFSSNDTVRSEIKRIRIPSVHSEFP